MTKSTQDHLLSLSSRFSKMLKRRFGKGPETCYVVLKENRLFIYIGNFITPAEEVLAEKNKIDLAANFRSEVMDAINVEFIKEASKVLGVAFDSYYHDWSYDTNKGIVIIENSIEKPEVKLNVFFERDLFALIEKVSSELHRTPNGLRIVKFNQSICTVECKGVLAILERLLYEKGNSDILLERSREIKKGFLKHKLLFEEIFNRTIEELFIVWDYQNDRSYIVFNFNNIRFSK